MVSHQQPQPLAAATVPSTHYYYADSVAQPSSQLVQQPAYMVQQQPMYAVQQQPSYVVQQPGCVAQQPTYVVQPAYMAQQPGCIPQGVPVLDEQPVAPPEMVQMVPPQQAGGEEVPMGKAVC